MPTIRKCEICGIRDAKYDCVRCGKEVCRGCFTLMVGLCKDCTQK